MRSPLAVALTAVRLAATPVTSVLAESEGMPAIVFPAMVTLIALLAGTCAVFGTPTPDRVSRM